jgi:hypothetical protein
MPGLAIVCLGMVDTAPGFSIHWKSTLPILQLEKGLRPGRPSAVRQFCGGDFGEKYGNRHIFAAARRRQALREC